MPGSAEIWVEEAPLGKPCFSVSTAGLFQHGWLSRVAMLSPRMFHHVLYIQLSVHQETLQPAVCITYLGWSQTNVLETVGSEGDLGRFVIFFTSIHERLPSGG